ncbi:MAG: glyoxalase/bleomycin resistance/extradiol dioxygenase family protein [Proteobacteria bacterium]|nr:glyoxalase/bleomycin resistance/extradiol dioxygenase family protein [Pseudomonadota bacterium]
MLVQPYLFFEGRCEEALEFYKKAVGAEVTMLMRNKESPDPESAKMKLPPGSENKVMHCEFKIGTTVLLASDGFCRGGDAAKFQGFSLTIGVADAAAASKAAAALSSEGGRVEMPQEKTFFSESFGMVVDKFGVNWIVIAQPK